jgi:glucose/mannose-6-phosphate isomerase
MINLDDLTIYQRLDPLGMFGHIAALPDQCEAGWKLMQSADLPPAFSRVDKIIVSGMGGSAIGASLLASLIANECRVPLFVVRDYTLPAFVGGPSCLVIGASYSGETEETLAAFEQARQRGCCLMALTTGGTLAQRAKECAAALVTFDYKSQPRAALGYSFTPLLALMCRLEFIADKVADLAQAVAVMRAWQKEIEPSSPVHKNSAKRLAGQMMGRNVVVWGSGCLAEVARRWKAQINENAKGWAAFEVLPEADHNAICGTLPDQVAGKTFVVFLASTLDHPRTQLRHAITRQVFLASGVNADVVAARGESALAQMLSTIHYGDYVSGYLGLLNEVDPTAIAGIVELKARLAEAKSICQSSQSML